MDDHEHGSPSRSVRIIDTASFRLPGSSGFPKLPVNMTKSPELLIDDNDYRVVAVGKCLGQVRQIGPACFRYMSYDNEDGTADDLTGAFKAIGFRLIIRYDGSFQIERYTNGETNGKHKEPIAKNAGPRR